MARGDSRFQRFLQRKLAREVAGKGPGSQQRFTMAISKVGKSPQGFFTFGDDRAFEYVDIPSTFDGTQAFEHDIDGYYGFKIEYYPEFAGTQSWTKGDITYFVDINDEVIEQKFPVDRDIRSLITALRIAVRRNRVRIGYIKRRLQAWITLAFLAPPVAVAFALAFGVEIPQITALAGAFGFAVALAWGSFWYQGQREGQLQIVVQSMGRTLANEIQARVNTLIKDFTDYLANIDREEASEDMTDVEWTHRSAWWAQMTMWNPKRIEYVEKFLQSEMQRLRIDYITTGFIGGSVANAITGVAIAAALGGMAYASTLGPSLADLLFPLISLGLGILGSLFALNRSKRTSLALTDVQAAIGPEPMGKGARFADINLHRKVAEQIRRDKEKLRQAKLSGGYGSGDRKPS